MSISCSRRGLLLWATVAAVLQRPERTRARAQPVPGWSLPIRNAGDIAGNGMIVRHGFACENTWFSHGNWHTAEDWYRAADANTAGAEVLAVSSGEVAWIGSDYPGRVVLILHANGLYGMYGHLDYAVDVAVGQQVTPGQVLGRVLDWRDRRAPSHLHVELRDFFLNSVVNGDTPQYGFNCGYRCPPGPGYWPIADARHPVEIGWRNPGHVIHGGLDGPAMPARVAVASTADGLRGPVRSAPSHDADGIGDIVLRGGDSFPVTGVRVGDPASMETSAEAYRIWYRVELPAGDVGWLPAVLADRRDTGSDGRPSSLRIVLLPLSS